MSGEKQELPVQYPSQQMMPDKWPTPGRENSVYELNIGVPDLDHHQEDIVAKNVLSFLNVILA